MFMNPKGLKKKKNSMKKTKTKYNKNNRKNIFKDTGENVILRI